MAKVGTKVFDFCNVAVGAIIILEKAAQMPGGRPHDDRRHEQRELSPARSPRRRFER
jgi:hypothetical protein